MSVITNPANVTKTTLSVAIPGTSSVAGSAPSVGYPSGTIVTPVSMTGIVAPGPNKSNRVVLWIDREAFEVIGITADGLSAICNRGYNGTLKVGHVVGVPVYVGSDVGIEWFNQDENGGGLGTYSQRAVEFFASNPSTAGVATRTALPWELLGGMITETPTAAENLTTPTAALIIAAMASLGNPFIGQSFKFTILNLAGGADTITLVAGTGVTLVGNTFTVAQNAARTFQVTITSVVSNTVSIYQCS